MVFRSKIDSFFIGIISVAILIIGAASFLPLFFEDEPLSAVLILTGFFLLTSAFILWTVFAIQYVFQEDHLFVKGGPFRSRIPYNSILKISPTRDIFTGYRILSSRDALELINNTTMFGTVKISPKDQSGFIMELEKRCPDLKIDEKIR